MSCHTEKVLCPYCGEEMEIMTVSRAVSGIIFARGAKKRKRRWSAWTSCTNDACIAEGPIVAEFETEQDARAEARAAAMRRYTPPITAETKLVCPINGAPCSECMPGSPCGVEVKDDKLLQKPLTLEEVKDIKAVWIEDPEQEYESKLYPAFYREVGNGSYSVFIADIDDGDQRAWYRNEEYGEWWRCWEREPTDEERRAAEWEA